MIDITRRSFFKLATISAAGAASGSAGGFFFNPAYAADEKINIDGVQHAAVYVTDMAKSIKFYKDMFGMEFLMSMDAMEGDKPLKIAFMGLNDFMLELLQPADTSKIISGAKATQNHICLRTNDANAMCAEFKKKGLAIEVGPFDSSMPFDRKLTEKGVFTAHNGDSVDLRLFFIRGINGERFEIMQDDPRTKPKSPALLGMHHAGIYAENIDDTVKFYEDVFGYKLLYKTEVMEVDKPLKMAWVKQGNLVLELLQPVDISKIESGARATQNHVCLRTDDMAKIVARIKQKNVEIEAGPFDTPCKFNEKLTNKRLFVKTSPESTNLKIFFIRGINGERYEIMQDNIG